MSAHLYFPAYALSNTYYTYVPFWFGVLGDSVTDTCKVIFPSCWPVFIMDNWLGKFPPSLITNSDLLKLKWTVAAAYSVDSVGISDNIKARKTSHTDCAYSPDWAFQDKHTSLSSIGWGNSQSCMHGYSYNFCAIITIVTYGSTCTISRTARAIPAVRLSAFMHDWIGRH